MFPEGPRVTSVADGKMANAATFTFLREDHTLGNMLRMCVVTPHLSPALQAARFCCRCEPCSAALTSPTRTTPPGARAPACAGSCCATLT